LGQSNDVWSLEVPVAVKADTGKAFGLANDLAHLEAAEFVNVAPSPDDLKSYGLDAPTLKVTILQNDAAKPAKTLLLGKPREGKPEVYTKLADAPEVFVIQQQIKN